MWQKRKGKNRHTEGGKSMIAGREKARRLEVCNSYFFVCLDYEARDAPRPLLAEDADPVAEAAPVLDTVVGDCERDPGAELVARVVLVVVVVVDAEEEDDEAGVTAVDVEAVVVAVSDEDGLEELVGEVCRSRQSVMRARNA